MLALPLSAACGGAAPAAPGPAAPPPAADKPADRDQTADKPAETPEEAASRRIPTACAEGGDGKVCLPPRLFVKRLCEGIHPDIALALLARGTPFTRGYLTRDVEAWNASGGASSSDKLRLDEEVLVLFHRVPDTGGMVVSGSGGGYDVLRWDGSCASLMSEELRLRAPAKPKHAVIPWKSLDEKTRAALEADEKVGKAVTDRRKECRGATMGEVSKKCEKADRAMSATIVEYVRAGGSLPAPPPLP
ncbi:MAG: hypothetical protein IT372_15455 [Polyangiaceae bacterium]|nr:hypothetical protein [Polyangiaceae bacterium]